MSSRSHSTPWINPTSSVVDHENDKCDANDDDENVKDDDDDFADLNKSIGKGNMMVEFFSAEIEFNV